jgi:DNA recombination protein RmuC
MVSFTNLLFLVAGLITGSIAAWMITRWRLSAHKNVNTSEFNKLEQDVILLSQRLEDARNESATLKNENITARQQLTALSIDLAKATADNSHLNEKFVYQKQEIEDLHKKIKEQFENIASKIIFDNSKMIQQQHTDKLTDILNPLKEKIEKFETAVTINHKENIRENQSLKEQIRQLQDINKTIGEEAKNLTTALKGQVKTQGNWGEVILESILQRSGLVRDREYFIQSSLLSTDGKRYQPDVLIRLPDNKTIIIDSKVALTAYERYSSCETEAERDLALREHILSVRRHIKGLGEKKYQQLYEINSLDFVLMFIPVEPAFSLAVQQEPAVFNEAFENNIVIVSTSTLLATLRTIASIWKLEYQNKNALEIARQSGALYDKFVGFITDIDKIGTNLENSQKAWEEARKKLSYGKGNLVNAAQKIKALGANTSKSIPESFLLDDPEEQ